MFYSRAQYLRPSTETETPLVSSLHSHSALKGKIRTRSTTEMNFAAVTASGTGQSQRTNVS